MTDVVPASDAPCLVCGQPRHPERSLRYAGHEAQFDNFCSTECARQAHGCPLPPTVTGPAKQAPCGTEYGYRKGCRCPDCRAVMTTARADRRRKEKAA